MPSACTRYRQKLRSWHHDYSGNLECLRFAATFVSRNRAFVDE